MQLRLAAVAWFAALAGLAFAAPTQKILITEDVKDEATARKLLSEATDSWKNLKAVNPTDMETLVIRSYWDLAEEIIKASHEKSNAGVDFSF